MKFRRIPAPLRKVLESLFSPLTGFANMQEWNEARILSVAALVLAPMVLLAGLTVQSQAGGVRDLFEMQYAYYQATFGMIGVYLLARTRWWRLGFVVGVLFLLYVIYQQMVFQSQHDTSNIANPLVWLVALIAACTVFMPVRYMIAVALVSVLFVALLPILIAPITFSDIHFSLFFVGAMSTFFVLTTYMREIVQRRLDKQREALSTSEARYRTLFESSFEPLVIHEGGVIVDSNPAFLNMMGYEQPQDVIGRSLLSMTTPEEAERVRANMALNVGAYETKAIHKDGRVIDVEVRSRSVVYQDRPMRVVALVDVTAKKNAEAERLRHEAEQQRGVILRQFVSDASHDLKTPLTVMNTSVHLLTKIRNDPEKSMRYLEKLSDQIKTMDKLLDDLFLMAKLDNPLYLADRMSVNVRNMMIDMAESYREAAAPKQITLELTLSEDAPMLQGDERELNRALDRILTNAIQYTPEGGQIHLCLDHDAHWATITIRDTGVGIEPNDLPLIFTRFYRADSARQAKGGMGLGLPIALKIVESHGGTIEAESQPGTGSTFRVRLPLERIAS